MLSIAYDADKLSDPDPCGWIVPDLWTHTTSGQIAIRMRCAGCGASGGWAFGPSSALADVSEQARALGPHGPM